MAALPFTAGFTLQFRHITALAMFAPRRGCNSRATINVQLIGELPVTNQFPDILQGLQIPGRVVTALVCAWLNVLPLLHDPCMVVENTMFQLVCPFEAATRDFLKTLGRLFQ